jgi:hypothetical protein
MAGETSINGTLNNDDLDPLWNAGLEIDILVDLSHNMNFKTRDADNTEIISKPIELDIAVKRGTCDATKWNALFASVATLAPAAAEIVNYINNAGGITRLNSSNVKIEVPNFAADIFDPNAAPYPASDAVTACRATDAEWDNLEDYQKAAFGMYLTNGQASGTLDSRPRTKI